MIDCQNTFAVICERLRVESDRHGEAHVDCPNCGSPAKRGCVHFSFGERGGYCFVCGRGYTLTQLADLYLGQAFTPPPAQSTRKPHRHYDWQSKADILLAEYARHPHSLELWQTYKQVSARMVKTNYLGVGVLPASRCRHERLIVPVIRNGVIVGLRGRAIRCDCGKWLSAGGSRYALYNAGELRTGKPTAIVENPIDALIATERWGYPVVATLGVTIWSEDYTHTLKTVCPEMAVVWYDNDAPGNATDQCILDAWRQAHRSEPPQRGIKLANHLLAQRVYAMPYRWPAGTPVKFDVGDMLK